MWQPKWAEAAIPEDALRLMELVKSAAYRVHRKLGAGFKESVYQRCLAHALERDGIKFSEHSQLTVEFEGLVIENAGQPDFVIEDRVVVEVKATEMAHSVHAAQLINYLKASGHPVGMVINFNVPYLKKGIDKYVHPDLLLRVDEGSPS